MVRRNGLNCLQAGFAKPLQPAAQSEYLRTRKPLGGPNQMSTVGFIGLGTMGRPMARHLLAAGHSLVVYARRPEAAAELVAAGARQAASPAEVTRAAEFVVT
ncbi:MAG: NAD(P)-binding domain-containing protein, partial [Pirellulales bacterium]